MIDILIDFEALSGTFSYQLEDPSFAKGTPYCFTMGLFKDGEYKSYTYVSTFSAKFIADPYAAIQKKILFVTKDIMERKVDEEELRFIVFGISLEKKILSKIFPKSEIKDLHVDDTFSLNKITDELISNEYEHFKETKIGINMKLTRSGFTEKDGAVAAFAGLQLYLKAAFPKSRGIIKTPAKTIAKEIKKYSKDDVNRIKELYIREDEYNANIPKIKKIQREMKRAKLELTKLKKTLVLIDKFVEEKLTIEQIQERSKKTIEELTKKIEKLDNKDIW